MKKVLPLIVFVLMTFMSSAQSILKEGYKLIPSKGGNMIGFVYNGKIGFISNSSDCYILIEPKFDDMYNENFYQSNNMILVSLNGKWGAIDSSGETPYSKQPIIPCEYSKMTPFRNGKSQVVKNGRTYTINTKGEIIR